MPEHIHMFVSLDNVTSFANYIHAIRNRLEDWLVTLFPILRKALQKELFSRSYFGGTIGNVSGLTLFGYLKEQWKEYSCFAKKYKLAKNMISPKQKFLNSFF